MKICLPSSPRLRCATESISWFYRSDRRSRRGIAVCVIAASLSLASMERCLAAELTMAPTLTLSEEYTDNVYEVETNKRTDYITRALPGLTMKYNAPFWDWDLAYNLDYRYYARNSRSDETTHYLLLKSLMKISDEVLFLDVSDTYQRVSLDVTRDNTKESLYRNQSDRNVGVVSPYLVLRPAANLTLKTGYRYINTWYEDPSAISKQDHVGFLSASYEFSPKMFITADYTFTWDLPETGSEYSRHELLVGPRYEYADKSFIYAQGGLISTDYDSGDRVENPSWKAGLTHSFDTVTATFTAGTSYAEDPLGIATLTTSYNLSLLKTFQRGTLTLNGAYRKYENGITEITENKSYSGGFAGMLEVLPDVKASLALTYERYRDTLLDADTDKYFVDSGIAWLAGKQLTLTLAYKFIDYSSAEIDEDNYRVNRLILEAKKAF